MPGRPPRSRRRGPGRRSARRLWSGRPGRACRQQAHRGRRRRRRCGAPARAPRDRRTGRPGAGRAGDPVAPGTRRTPRAASRATRRCHPDPAQRSVGPSGWRRSSPPRGARPGQSPTAAASRPARHRRTPPPAGPPPPGRRPGLHRHTEASGFGSVLVNRLTPTTTSSPASIRAAARPARRPDWTSCSQTPPRPPRRRSPGPGPLRRTPSMMEATLASTTASGEQVVVLQQVALVGQHLLQPQRPLVVRPAGAGERLVPGRQLHRPGPGVPGQRDAEHLQHDPLHVVLRLRLVRPSELTCTAVPEPAVPRVAHPVPGPWSARPTARRTPQLANLSGRTAPGVTKNEIRPTTEPNRSAGSWPESRTASSTAIAVQSARRPPDRGGAGLLQVVGAHVIGSTGAAG